MLRLQRIKNTPLIEKGDGEILLFKIKTWDEALNQRKSQAYDDVENFENKFSAEYLYLFNQTGGVESNRRSIVKYRNF